METNLQSKFLTLYFDSKYNEGIKFILSDTVIFIPREELLYITYL